MQADQDGNTVGVYMLYCLFSQEAALRKATVALLLRYMAIYRE